MQFLDATNPTESVSRLAAGAAVLLASLTGLVAVSISPVNHPGSDVAASVQVGEAAGIHLAESDLDKVISFCARHTTRERGFVVFRNGTCVIIGEPSEDPVASAERLLRETSQPEAKFLSERTAEGDLIVTFGGVVFHWIPADEIPGLTVWTGTNFQSLLSENEKSIAEDGWMPPYDARLGLVARMRLLEDGAEPEVLKVIRPRSQTVAEDSMSFSD